MIIVFVDTGNTGRSPMIAALARYLVQINHLGDSVLIESAAVEIDPTDPNIEWSAALALAECGLNICDHVPRALDYAQILKADFVLTMTKENTYNVYTHFAAYPPPTLMKKVQSIGQFLGNPNLQIEDTIYKATPAYVNARNQFIGLLGQIFTRIKTLDPRLSGHLQWPPQHWPPPIRIPQEMSTLIWQQAQPGELPLLRDFVSKGILPEH